MAEVNYVTAHNLYDVEDLPLHPRLTAAALRKSRKQMARLRKSVKKILDYATKGAAELRGGNYWSESIDMFESYSMEQARKLAKFPIRINHHKFGRIVFQSRAAFVAFREIVRHEIVGKVFTGTEAPEYDAILDLVTANANQTSDGMARVEDALKSAGY